MLMEPRPDNDVSMAILQAGERAFAEFGYDGASMRAIARDAGVNQAMIAYYFGSKEGLLRAVLGRRSQFVNARRETRLSALMAGATPSIEAVVHAFLDPLIELGMDKTRGGSAYIKLLAVLTNSTDDLARQLAAEHFDGIARKFVDAFRRIEPSLSESDAIRAYLFTLGVGLASINVEMRAGPLSEGRYDRPDRQALTAAVVGFASGGVRSLMQRN